MHFCLLALYTLLMNNLDECLVETTKVLGNLSRSKPARDFLLETGGKNSSTPLNTRNMIDFT